MHAQKPMFQKIWKKKIAKSEGRLTDHELTYREIREGDQKRLVTIYDEFKHTFRFLKNYPRSVSFFGSARFPENHPCYEQARSLARRIVAETGYTIVTGGGPGIMEAANRGAYEAGGKSIGMNIILPHEQKMNEYLTAHIRFYYFFIRKVALSFSAEVYIFFPGGFGTLDEFFELVTLSQTRKIPRVPIICVGKNYWKHVDALANVLRDEYRTISPGDERLFHIVDDEEEVIRIIKSSPLRKE
ncbi:MAG: TIGR00730 family Rossman fold protein [Patescibacteria group bacterium]|nr:TIGR00730 family Rossman fold protein [Patescibacteria group bacterium]MDE2116304.1 TIGR00730 family Rossman fold protein [Patescibacteria group bacterium]